MFSFNRRLKRSIEKTWPETGRLLTGRAPGFVYGGAVRAIPVFTYHAVDSGFESDLLALREGGYRTIGARELETVVSGERPAGKREVVLTFDDGHESLTTVAVPLLSEHGFLALAFVVAGLVPPRSSGGLAGWEELSSAAAEGVLQIGSHSLFHHQVPTGPKVIGFVAPGTDSSFAANIPVPRMAGGDRPATGSPILCGRPRYLARRAFRPDASATELFTNFAAEQGPHFFERHDWRRVLRSAATVTGDYETAEASERAVLDDMRLSMDLIERHCPGPATRHLCYPWYAGDERSDRIARSAGIRLLYGGIETPGRQPSTERPGRVRRLPRDFLRRLPGPQRVPLRALLARRLRVILGRAS